MTVAMWAWIKIASWCCPFSFAKKQLFSIFSAKCFLSGHLRLSLRVSTIERCVLWWLRTDIKWEEDEGGNIFSLWGWTSVKWGNYTFYREGTKPMYAMLEAGFFQRRLSSGEKSSARDRTRIKTAELSKVGLVRLFAKKSTIKELEKERKNQKQQRAKMKNDLWPSTILPLNSAHG